VDGFDGQFDELWGRAYAVAFVVLGDRTEAEDVAQETMARALVRWRKVAAYAEPFVIRVAGNLAVDHVRKQSRPRRMVVTDVPAPDGRRVDLQQALLALSPRQRDVVVMRYLADLPEADVAATLKCSVGTVRTHASRGLAALRRVLEDSHE
jgi:RNA polymerase sigma factor (sigma-70 family)